LEGTWANKDSSQYIVPFKTRGEKKKPFPGEGSGGEVPWGQESDHIRRSKRTRALIGKGGRSPDTGRNPVRKNLTGPVISGRKKDSTQQLRGEKVNRAGGRSSPGARRKCRRGNVRSPSKVNTSGGEGDSSRKNSMRGEKRVLGHESASHFEGLKRSLGKGGTLEEEWGCSWKGDQSQRQKLGRGSST